MAKFILGLVALVAIAAVAYSETQDDKTVKKGERPAAAPPAKTAETAPAANAAAPKPKTTNGLATSAVSAAKAKPHEADPEKVDWKKVDWRKRLTPLQYHITREAGTERPYQNEYWNHFEDGEYRCVNCGLALFESTSKFDSDCGWPSFDRTLTKDAVTKHVDHKLFTPRTEIRCRRCGAHLGHVFDDGPTKTGQRYCMNSAAMNFVPAKGAVKKDSPKKEAVEAPTSATPATKEAPAAAPATDAAQTKTKKPDAKN